MGDEPDPLAVIGAALPDLRIDRVERLGEGWDHVAFLVNGDLVFRLPWEPGEHDARPEVELLRAVAGRVPVEVPEPVHVDPGGEWFAYRFLPGRPLTDVLDEWSSADRLAELARLVVDLTLAVHDAVPPEEAARLGLAVDHDPSAPLLTLHADLGLDHVLVDETGRPYAVIDWSDARVARVEVQLAALAWDLPDLVDLAGDEYERRTGAVVDRSHAASLAATNAADDLAELRADGASDDDPEVRRCLAVIDWWSSR